MIRELIHIIIGKILDFLFPSECVGCQKNGLIICEECLNSLPVSSFTKTLNLYFSQGQEKRPVRLLSATSYQASAMKKALRLFKYKGGKILADPIGHFIFKRTFQYLGDIEKTKTIIIPVPLSKKRLKERGFNQAELIAKSLGKISGIPVFSKNLVKKFDTASQVEMPGKKERLKNLKGSFEIQSPENIKGRTIILVDDVATTGATLFESSRMLKKAGAADIICVVAAS